MKKFFCLAGICICCLFSCTDTTKPAADTTAAPEQSQAEKNKAVNRAIMKAIEAGDSAAIDTLIAADAIDHSGPKGTEVKGDSLKNMLRHMHSSVTDLKMDFYKLIIHHLKQISYASKPNIIFRIKTRSF